MSSQNGKIIVVVIAILMAAGMFVMNRNNSQVAPVMTGGSQVVTDSTGRQVTVPVNPQRVIVLNASNLDLFLAAGGSVVGMPTSEALTPAVRAKVAGVPEVGNMANPNVEQIMALNPDLVIGVSVPFHHALEPVLAKAGIPIIFQGIDTYQQILDTLTFYGTLTGQVDQAAAAVAQIEDASRKAVAINNAQSQPQVMIVWGSTESFTMATAKSFPGDLLMRVGAVNSADVAGSLTDNSAYVPLSMEFVAKVNPDVILLITHSSNTKVGEKFKTEFSAHPAWQGLKAVQTNRVHQLPYDLFAVNPGTRVAEAVTVLARLVYPEVKSP